MIKHNKILRDSIYGSLQGLIRDCGPIQNNKQSIMPAANNITKNVLAKLYKYGKEAMATTLATYMMEEEITSLKQQRDSLLQKMPGSRTS